MRAKTIVLLVASLLIAGCIEKQGVIVSDTYEDITNNLQMKCIPNIDMSPCNDYAENHINGNYVNWSGEVSDIKDEVVYVHLRKLVALHDVDEKTLGLLERGQRIRFISKINIEKGMFPNTYYTTWVGTNRLDLYNTYIEFE